ncbi:hypothetical protein LguiA_031462 [Lonicera macranthoides]
MKYHRWLSSNSIASPEVRYILQAKTMEFNPSSSHSPPLSLHRRGSQEKAFHSPTSAGAMLSESTTSSSSSVLLRRILTAAVLFAVVSLSCFVLFRASDTGRIRRPNFSGSSSSDLSYVYPFVADDGPPLSLLFDWVVVSPLSGFEKGDSNENKLETVLKDAAMEDGTDADIMWFRDPFPRFYEDADFQIACDHFCGNSIDLENNTPNGGFNFVKSNNRSIEFYKFWYSSRENYPGLHDQDVLNNIKYDSFITEIDLKIKFLNTAYFGGFCEPSKDLNYVCTMHANCCFGLDSKVHDLKILLEDWKQFMSLPPTMKRSSMLSWRAPKNCR